MRTRPLLLLLKALVVIVALCGCSAHDPVIQLRQWNLEPPNSTQAIPISLPAHLNTYLPNYKCRFVLHTGVQLPPNFRSKPLTLAIAHLQAPSVLTVNGEEAIALDPASPNLYRSTDVHRWLIPKPLSEENTSLELDLTVEQTWMHAAWIDSIPRLSPMQGGDTSFLRVVAFNQVTAIASLVTIGLLAFYYGVLFLTDTRRRLAHGWFVLEAIGCFYYPLFALGWSQNIFGKYDVNVMGWTLAITIIASIYFMHAQLKIGDPHRAWTYVFLLCVIAEVFSLGYFRQPDYASFLVSIFFFISVVYQVGHLVRALRQRPIVVEKILVTVSWPICCIVSVTDFAVWLGSGDFLADLRGSCAGITSFCLLHAVAQSREHITSLRRADEFNRELGARVHLLQLQNRKIKTLNDELRRQVTTRSARLVNVLGRMRQKPLVISPFGPGDVIDERYRVLRTIGSGGMGSVYEVEHMNTGQYFALKVLKGHIHTRILARFAREAQLISQIDHANVVSVFDVDISASGVPFIIMELIRGLSLELEAVNHNQMDWVLRILAQIADGLAAIHDSGIIHRDLKPANIIISKDRDHPCAEVVKIADFGIASLTSQPDIAHEIAENDEGKVKREEKTRKLRIPSSLTDTGILLGTPLYMAPELGKGSKHAQPASDIFSFGVIAFELLSGELPFKEPAVIACLNGRKLQPQPLAQLCPQVPKELVILFDRCLNFDMEQRPSASDIAVAMRSFAPRSGVISVRPHQVVCNKLA